ncbi:hypothetical protein B0H15DRAFT_1001485 [Mycena belliarum]|uniref:Polyadenylate-binding protein n=1 Tax=Mycena belliarum TaxID=1033014 RepID=A0AAD6TSN0_9AGAR|nr:hypothetical protein B0H15DRAFT_1001485 [Mycena belliae]
MWSQRDPALRKTGQGNIFIENLDEAIDNKALHDTFAAFGNVLSCKVATDEHGQSKGYGFVHYETCEAADSAIKAVNGMLLNDKKVYVGHHISRKECQSKFDEMKSQFTNLYVENVDPEMSQDEFEKLFTTHGTLISALIQVDDRGKSKGFGFVKDENHKDAQKAVDALHDSGHYGKKLFREEELRRSYEQVKMEKLSKYQGVNLHIKNLEDDVDGDKLRTEFEAFGSVTSCKVMRDDKGTSKGFGFATKATAEMNNKMIGSKPLYVSLAQRREVRRQQLESQIAQRNQIRMQQAAAAGLPGGYINGPMYYPPGPDFAPQGRGMMGYPGQPGMMPPRPRYLPNNGPVAGMPMPAPYPPRHAARCPLASAAHPVPPRSRLQPAAHAQGGRLPPAPRSAHPRPRASRHRTARPPQVLPLRAVPPPSPDTSSTRRCATAVRMSPAALATASPMEQKQMLGEGIYIKIASTQPELAGKITGMLLEMDNSKLLHLLDSPVAIAGKVNEALAVLQEFVKEG